MSELTQEQIAKVASLIKGAEYTVITLGPNGGGIPYVVKKDDPYNTLWKPEFHPTDQYRRSQALAVVEWLASQGDYPRHEGDDVVTDGLIEFESRVMAAIRRKDITALQAMVIELGEL